MTTPTAIADRTAWRRPTSTCWLLEQDGCRVGVLALGLRYAAIGPAGRVLGRTWTLAGAQRIAERSRRRAEVR